MSISLLSPILLDLQNLSTPDIYYTLSPALRLSLRAGVMTQSST